MTNDDKYMTEEQANKVLIEGNNLYRKWFQIEMPIRQDVAEQLMEYEGLYQNGKKEVRLSGESLYFAFSKLCRLVDFKNSNLTENKSFMVYHGYTETTIAKKILKIGSSKFNAIKKMLYNCGLLDIVKRTYVWESEGQKIHGTRNVFVLNRIPTYAEETNYCELDWNWRDYNKDKSEDNLSKQCIANNPYNEKTEKNSRDMKKETENPTMGISTMGISTIGNPTMGISIMGEHIKSLYDLSSSYKNNQVSISKSINQSNDREIELEDINKIISKCELDCFRGYDKYQYNADSVISTVKTTLTYMYYAETFKVNGINLPKIFVRQEMQKLNHIIIEHALNNFEQATKSKEIHNPMMYLQVCIFNAINSIDIEVQADVNYMMNNDYRFDDTIFTPEGSTEKEEVQSEDITKSLSERYMGTIMEEPIIEISTEITSVSYKTFFDVIEKLEIDDDTLLITVPNNFVGDRLQIVYKTLILEKFKHIGIAEIKVFSTEK